MRNKWIVLYSPVQSTVIYVDPTNIAGWVQPNPSQNADLPVAFVYLKHKINGMDVLQFKGDISDLLRLQ